MTCYQGRPSRDCFLDSENIEWWGNFPWFRRDMKSQSLGWYFLFLDQQPQPQKKMLNHLKSYLQLPLWCLPQLQSPRGLDGNQLWVWYSYGYSQGEARTWRGLLQSFYGQPGAWLKDLGVFPCGGHSWLKSVQAVKRGDIPGVTAWSQDPGGPQKTSWGPNASEFPDIS